MGDREWSVPEPSELRSALARGRDAVVVLAAGAHPADLAPWLGDLEPDEARGVFDALATDVQVAVVESAGDGLRAALAGALPVARLAELARALPPDEAADLLALVPPHVADAALARLDPPAARAVRHLLGHAPETAGGIMTNDFDAFAPDVRVGDAVKALRRDAAPSEVGTGVWIVDARQHLLGHVDDRALLRSRVHATLGEVMVPAPALLRVDDDQELVARVFARYREPALPVVDAHGALVGVVTADDVLTVALDEAREDMQRLAGAGPEAQSRLPVLRRVRQRLPLMALTVLGGLATAKVLDLWLASADAVGEQVGLLDFMRYVPIVLGLAGNVGIQSSTILVRGLATGEVAAGREARHVRAEVATGAILGALCGAATALAAALAESHHGPAFGLAVGGAVAIAVAWAALLGCLVPLVCRRLAIDPAVAAGPALITLSDLSAASIYLAVATLAERAAEALA